MSASDRSVIIVGAGIIGLTTAFRLARRGYRVTILDPAPAMGATHAAAGMLAPTAEIAPGDEENYRYQQGALSAWRALAHELAELTGYELSITQTGTLIVGWDGGDRRLIEQFRGVAERFGAPLRTVTRDEEPEMFRGITTRLREGLFMGEDAWLDPDAAVAQLLEANQCLSVRLIEERVTEVLARIHGVAVRSASGVTEADLGIVATGAAGLPPGLGEPSSAHVRPVRGVTVRVRGIDRHGAPTVRAFLRGRAFYMVSRPGGYCVLGATAEEKAEPLVEVGELQRLLRDGLDIVPELEAATFLEVRNGLRPATADLRPFVAELPGTGWTWTSGHYRHGVTVAPLAATNALEALDHR